MSTHDSLSDPTDWLGTPLSCLYSLESAFRCHVCKEFFDTPVITSCSHTFCSLCIRKCLSQEGKCPACRSGDQESKLRRNWAMEECVNAHQKQRNGLLDLASRLAREGGNSGGGATWEEAELTTRPAKRRRIREHGEGEERAAVSTRSTRSRSRMASQPRVETVEPDFVEDGDGQGSEYSDGDETPRPETTRSTPDDGLVACPMCHRRMKEEAVFTHLDQCDGAANRSPRKRLGPKTAEGTPSTSVAYTIASPSRSRQRLGALNYSLLSEAALRKKLSEIGMPAHGPKPLMQRRHVEWMNLWNASCDSTNPKSKKDLLRELEVWERTQGRQIGSIQAGASGVMAKGFDAEAWTRRNKSDFAELIRKAKGKADVQQSPAALGGKGGEEEPQRQRSPDPEPVTGLEHSSPRNGGVVDLTSPQKPPLGQQQRQQSQGSQVNGVAA